MEILITSCENWMWKSIVIIYVKTTLPKNQMNLKKLKTW
jgi:hypothetical protein